MPFFIAAPIKLNGLVEIVTVEIVAVWNREARAIPRILVSRVNTAVHIVACARKAPAVAGGHPPTDCARQIAETMDILWRDCAVGGLYTIGRDDAPRDAEDAED